MVFGAKGQNKPPLGVKNVKLPPPWFWNTSKPMIVVVFNLSLAVSVGFIISKKKEKKNAISIVRTHFVVISSLCSVVILFSVVVVAHHVLLLLFLYLLRIGSWVCVGHSFACWSHNFGWLLFVVSWKLATKNGINRQSVKFSLFFSNLNVNANANARIYCPAQQSMQKLHFARRTVEQLKHPNEHQLIFSCKIN